MFERWPFFHNLIETLQTALDKTDLTLGARYFELADEPAAAARIWSAITAEHGFAVRRVGEIRDGRPNRDGALEPGRSPGRDAAPDPDRAPDAERTAWLDVLAFLQVELLRRHRAGDPGAREPLLASVAAIATGLRGTG